MKLKAKEYREFIMGCVKLYGVIDSNDAFTILKKYYPEATKKEFLIDLKERNQKLTKDYIIWSTSKRNLFLLTTDRIDDEEIDNLIDAQLDKPFYVPKTYEGFVKAASFETFKKENEKTVAKFIKILANAHKDKNIKQAELSISIIYEDLRDLDRMKDFDPMQFAFRRLSLWGYEFTRESIESFLSALQELINNIRYPANRGYTPKELRRIEASIDPNKITMSIGPNMKKMFESGEMDIKEYADGIINSKLPPSVKKSLLDELNEIIKEVEETPKA